jgi:hypothetical protein
MHRRNWLTWLAACLLLNAGLSQVRGQQKDEVTLAERLRAGLKCRRPEEVDFVDDVVALVDQKKLGVDLVLSTYQWAVKQRPDFPFYYFQYGIRRRAAAIGVDI